MKRYYKAGILASILFLTACGSNNQIYNWGEGAYSTAMYQSLTQEGDPQAQLKALEDIAQDPSKGKKVPPGLYAQIGLLYSQLGDTSKATEAFNMETQLFPESKSYIQFLLTKGMRGGKK
ncbi:hypothetical protein BKK49_01170 [Rodentibacter rarus]|uniref:DUF4810 domain-containing protein n=1 Tax=Rodentibacter rarus TaxID=1908260 RepID=UPI00098476AC|nr:DUF4810 domain-containing protein [Rodentibacter rarus]OOF43072.1 hypothetical protein BKK49_01170 [Rodentibacter rarus]